MTRFPPEATWIDLSSPTREEEKAVEAVVGINIPTREEMQEIETSSRLREEAEAYKARVVAQAEGDAQRFRSVLAEYQKAPAVTRDRLYIETMQQIYSNVTKVMVDSRNNSNLLYLPLDRLLQGGGTAGSTAPAPAPGVAEQVAPTVIDVRARADARSRDREGR